MDQNDARDSLTSVAGGKNYENVTFKGGLEHHLASKLARRITEGPVQYQGKWIGLAEVTESVAYEGMAYQSQKIVSTHTHIHTHNHTHKHTQPHTLTNTHKHKYTYTHAHTHTHTHTHTHVNTNILT